MNAKIIEALKGIRDNLNILIDEMEGNDTSVVEEVTAEIPVEAVVIESQEEATEVSETEETTPEVAPTKSSRKEREANEKLPDHTDDEITQEQLDGLSYNNLKRLAKEMGIPAVGSRDELTQKILNFNGEAVEAEEAPAEEEVAPAKSPRTTKSKKVEVAEAESEDGDEDEEVDPLVQKVNEAVEDMTDEDIMDILADVGVKAKGKRQALISAVIKAVRDGKIDLDDEEESEESEEVEEVEEAESASDENTEWGVNDPENPDMTAERRAAIEAYEADIRADFKKGDLTRKQLVEWLNDFYDNRDSMKKKSDEEILDEYIARSCLLINDEGEMPEEEGAYTVNGVPYCCGHELAYNEDNETYICEVCGAEYEAGEE